MKFEMFTFFYINIKVQSAVQSKEFVNPWLIHG